jgi:hypothetical protein
MPSAAHGRPGDVALPCLFAGDGNGALSLDAEPAPSGPPTRLQVESYKPSKEVTAGIVTCARPEEAACLVVPRGERHAVLSLRLERLMPGAAGATGVRRARAAPPGLARHWTSQFACFRPELGGFSNSAVSVNCHQNHHTAVDIAAFTRKPAHGPDPLDLARFTVARALMNGSGYGFWRNLYLDSDPVLVSAAGRIHQVDPRPAWLRSVAPGIRAAVARMLATKDPATGLAICRDLSGDSGSFRWSCNAWDVVGFGHLDAYVNAWTYRAMRNAAALLADLGDAEQARRCREFAACIRAGYGPTLLNPATGWVSCWKSRDGALHDYASPFINGPACAFGLLEPEAARRALSGLERLRDERGLSSAGLSIPFMLDPIDPADHLMPRIFGGGVTEPTFECYTDGSLGACAAPYYLRALATHGFADRARVMAGEIDRGFADGLFSGPPGGVGEAREFTTWEGLSAGYEGTFVLSFGVLYAVAVAHGLIEPTIPEWWPESE